MSGYADEAATIRQRFYVEWANRTAIAQENATFEPAADTAWVRLTIRNAEAEQTEIGRTGSRTFRHPGVVICQVFVPTNTGDGPARTLAESACAIFRGVAVDNLTFAAPYIEPRGSEAKWFGYNAVCPFWRDDQF